MACYLKSDKLITYKECSIREKLIPFHCMYTFNIFDFQLLLRTRNFLKYIFYESNKLKG